MPRFNNSNQRLNGLNPLAYIGDNAYQPPEFNTDNRPPTPNDAQNFQLGAIWLDTSTNVPPHTENIWMLVALLGGQATWVNFGGGTMTGLRTQDLNVVTPTAGIINVIGAGLINTTGTVGPNTVTINASDTIAASFPTDAGTATPSLNTLNVFGGTAGRDINTTGSGNTIHVELNNTIMVGDLSTVAHGSPSITMTSGDLFINAGTALAATNPKIVFGAQNNLISFLFNNVFIGSSAGNETMTQGVALFNIGIGSLTSQALTTGARNTAIGNGTLQDTTTGSQNCAYGYTALTNVTTGSSNVAIGHEAFDGTAGLGLITGNRNIGIGDTAGANYRAAESDNILLNNSGILGDTNTMRIGAGTGTANAQLNKTFISGIRGITTAVNDAVAVLIDSAGQLGTVSSSERYKDNIEDMDDYSSDILDLRCVTFNFKKHSSDIVSVGLIAEEVEEIFPRLVVKDEEGRPETVRYLDVIPMLLNELQKLASRVDVLESKIKEIGKKHK